MSAGRVIGWKVSQEARASLLDRFVPVYPAVVADHVTLEVDEAGRKPAPPDAQGRIVGVADDGRGVQALVVALNGTTVRPDGKVYHVTWSLAPGRRAVESNDVIAAGKWTALDEAVPLQLFGARF